MSTSENKTDTVDMFGDCLQFATLYNERTGSHFKGKIDRKFIREMVMDELDELDEAKDEAEEVDALLDATYYILNHLAGTGLDIRPIWSRIHRANMEKFGPGGRKRERDGKWLKPPDFQHPDDDIREEIRRQRAEQKGEKGEMGEIDPCPCGGGQSCIVDRRSFGDLVHEDIVFKKAGVPLRKNCVQEPTTDQQKAMTDAMLGHDSVMISKSE